MNTKHGNLRSHGDTESRRSVFMSLLRVSASPRPTSACIFLLVVAALARLSSQSIPQDTGAAGAWQKLLKVKTTASVMHVDRAPGR